MNERIRLLEAPSARGYDFICECDDDACTRVMHMEALEYKTLRFDPRQFAVVPGHERPELDEILLRTERYVLLRARRPQEPE